MPERRELLEAVGAALERAGIEVARYGLRFRFDAEALIMEGEVPTIVDKRSLVRVVRGVPGAHEVVDKVRIKPTELRDDPAISRGFARAILAEPDFADCNVILWQRGCSETVRYLADTNACDLHAKVEHGVVTLSGEVLNLRQKRLAGTLAWWTPGTRNVINHLTVAYGEEDTDQALTEAVRLILEKDPQVETGHIRISAHDHVVTLEGDVERTEQRAVAECDTWFVAGVDEVHNHLAVRS